MIEAQQSKSLEATRLPAALKVAGETTKTSFELLPMLRHIEIGMQPHQVPGANAMLYFCHGSFAAGDQPKLHKL